MRKNVQTKPDARSPHRDTKKLITRWIALLLLLIAPALYAESFETARLKMRPLVAEDWEVAKKLNTDPEVMNNANIELPIEEFRGWFDEMVLENAVYRELRKIRGVSFLITTKDGNAPIGTVMLQRYKPKKYWEVTYVFEPDAWGQGYGKEMQRGLVRFAFEELKIPGMIATVAKTNIPSERILLALGFHLENDNVQNEERARHTKDPSIIWKEYRLSQKDYFKLRVLGGVFDPCPINAGIIAQ